MNTISMPGFTAEDSVYKMSGHYQAGRHAINSPHFKRYNQGERLPAGIKLVPAGTLVGAPLWLAGPAEE